MERRDPESLRLAAEARREANWKRWGPYLSERQWGTVREDYSLGGSCWDYFPHDHARSRVYRWGEDGLLGISDREGRLCFGLALWNGQDPILKERLFGLTGPEGNHGEDVKERYYYQDSTPTHSYMKGLYVYPQAEFPYGRLVTENRRRGRDQREFELVDTGVLDEDRVFDVTAEYAKASPNDVLIRLTLTNRGPEQRTLHVLPSLWFRNTWAWGRQGQEGYFPKPSITLGEGALLAEHDSLGRFRLAFEGAPPALFTDNESNAERLWGVPNEHPWVKDGFHALVVHGRQEAVNPEQVGTKAALHHVLELPPGGEVTLRLRLSSEDEAPGQAFADFDAVFAQRIAEADTFYAARIGDEVTAEERQVARQAYAGLLWSKQFYFYVVKDWLEGDPSQPAPPPGREHGRNAQWPLLYNRDVLMMPDTWEYPWYAAWDLAFHAVAVARIDPTLATRQLILMLREWYMHPNGQIPAYEFAFGDVNPPVHAWAVWRVYKMTGPRGARDRGFLERCFHKLMLNFTWWVNRKDADGNNLFSGGFLGLDNIGVFDRSNPPGGGIELEQADGSAWMAFFCGTMLSIALELAGEDRVYQDVASKFFEHFVAIVDAMNGIGGLGLWDHEDGFYYDQLHQDGQFVRLRVRSMVGLVPLFAVEVLESDVLETLPGFRKRMDWFLENREDLNDSCAYLDPHDHGHRLLAIPSRERLKQVLRYVLDEEEFLSPHGVRSLSRVHHERPFVLHCDGVEHTVEYSPGESTTGMFGGNSNWRGPIWFPLNYLLVEALERYHYFYGDEFRVECPAGSGRELTLLEVSRELGRRLVGLFLPDEDGHRPCLAGGDHRALAPHERDRVLFHEYFHGETGRGLGASHQTGWTALVARMIQDVAVARERG